MAFLRACESCVQAYIAYESKTLMFIGPIICRSIDCRGDPRVLLPDADVEQLRRVGQAGAGSRPLEHHWSEILKGGLNSSKNLSYRTDWFPILDNWQDRDLHRLQTRVPHSIRASHASHLTISCNHIYCIDSVPHSHCSQHHGLSWHLCPSFLSFILTDQFTSHNHGCQHSKIFVVLLANVDIHNSDDFIIFRYCIYTLLQHISGK